MDLIRTLKEVEIFKVFSSEALADFATVLEKVTIKSEETLVNEGDEGECLYIIVQGRLQVRKEGLGIIGEIGTGEVVGEVALLAKEKRTATVLAIRDTVLLKCSLESFSKFTLDHPGTLQVFVQNSMKRLLQKNIMPNKRSPSKTIVLAPAGKNPLFREFVKKFISALSAKKKILHLRSSDQITSASHLSDLEEEYHHIIYEADETFSSWSELALRQADRTLFIGLEEQEDVSLNDIEKNFFGKNRLKNSHLILIYEKKTYSITHAHEWLSLREGVKHHHLRLSYDEDFFRLIRFILGESISLVLSGGGARGIAFVGVIKAFEELKIPIDYIGGTSMGAVIGGGVALGMDYEACKEHVRKYVVPAIKAMDYTFPFLSLKSGKGVVKGLLASLGKNTRIEDCPISFFCVSTNLSKYCMQIHDKGSLWEAVRASLAIPAVFPPVIGEDGDLLIDGGITNNLPVDIMQGRVNGGRVIAVSLSPPKCGTYTKLPFVVSGWKLFWRKLIGKEGRVPHLGDVLLSAFMRGGSQYQLEMEKSADFCIKLSLPGYGLFDAQLYKEIIDAGYRQAMEQLKGLRLD